MGATVVISSASHHRIACGRAWLEARAPAEEVLIVATPDAANELARVVVQTKGAAFGYHRMTLARLAVTLARPALAARHAVPLGRVGVEGSESSRP
jgi:ATP-dependent helicase/nuclease subunit B